MTSEQQYRGLVESLRLVAASADQQLAALPQFVSPTDEVATTFGDAFLLVPQLRKAGLLSPESVSALQQLDDWFSAMPTDGSIATAQSLAHHKFWVVARQLASDALAHLGEDVAPPDLRHVYWSR